MLIAVCAFVAGCGKGKGPMTLNAVGSDIDTYKSAFKKYFTVSAIDAKQLFSDNSYFTVTPSRYVVCVIPSNVRHVKPYLKPYDKGFLIMISEDDKTVHVEIVYTVGAKKENPAVVNPNLIAGLMTMTKNITITPKGEKGTAARAVAVAEAIHNMLTDIEN